MQVESASGPVFDKVVRRHHGWIGQETAHLPGKRERANNQAGHRQDGAKPHAEI